MVAMGTNALVPRELDLVHDLRTARAFLPETLRDLAFFARFLEGWSFEDGHVIRRGPRSPHARKSRRLFGGPAHIRSGSSRWLIRRRSKAPATLARSGFFVNERRHANFPCARRDHERSGWWCNGCARGGAGAGWRQRPRAIPRGAPPG